jgi:hypothetical protein
MRVDPRAVIEGARRMARASARAMAPKLAGVSNAATLIHHRHEIVTDSYLTGAAEMLKLLMGDASPEPWTEDYKHEPRIAELLKKFQEQE